MSPETSRTVANVVMAVTAGVAAYVILRSPSLRRAAWRTLRTGVTTTLPGFLAREVITAWEASGQRP